MDKKLNDCLVTAIQNSPETTISEHSNRQKLEVKELQKKHNNLELEGTCVPQLNKNTSHLKRLWSD